MPGLPASGRARLQPLVGPVLVAMIPAAIAWAPGFSAGDAGAPAGGTPLAATTLTFPAPSSGGSSAPRVELAGRDGRIVALVAAADARRTELLELRPAAEARPVHAFPRGATHPTLGTDAAGRPVVLVRACGAGTAKPKACALRQVELDSGKASAVPGTTNAAIGAMDRGITVVARGARLTMVRPAGLSGAAPRTIALPAIPEVRGTAPSSVDGLDLRDGVVAATVGIPSEFGSSGLLRHDARRGWTTLGVSSWGGAALGPRPFLTPQAESTGVRALFDGAEDEAGYVARWGAGPRPVRTVKLPRSGSTVFVRSAAFLGDRLVTVTEDDPCLGTPCRLTATGPYALG